MWHKGLRLYLGLWELPSFLLAHVLGTEEIAPWKVLLAKAEPRRNLSFTCMQAESQKGHMPTFLLYFTLGIVLSMLMPHCHHWNTKETTKNLPFGVRGDKWELLSFLPSIIFSLWVIHKGMTSELSFPTWSFMLKVRGYKRLTCQPTIPPPAPCQAASLPQPKWTPRKFFGILSMLIALRMLGYQCDLGISLLLSDRLLNRNTYVPQSKNFMS